MEGRNQTNSNTLIRQKLTILSIVKRIYNPKKTPKSILFENKKNMLFTKIEKIQDEDNIQNNQDKEVLFIKIINFYKKRTEINYDKLRINIDEKIENIIIPKVFKKSINPPFIKINNKTKDKLDHRILYPDDNDKEDKHQETNHLKLKSKLLEKVINEGTHDY